MTRRLISMLTALCVLTSFQAVARQKVKVACVGNSITYGMDILNRENNSYPAQLQHMLGDNYDVRNFGHSGATLLKNGNKPYYKTNEYAAALAFEPDIVFIKLGTNDTKAVNRPFYKEFIKDYNELVSSFENLSTHPRVIILLPLPSFSTDSNYISNKILLQDILPMEQQVAFERKLEVVNLYPLFIDKPELFPDKIHPSSLGAAILATRIYEVICQKRNTGGDIFSAIRYNKQLSSFYGFECADFMFNGRNCKVVKPKAAAPDNPWIWRARFWGHEPQTDISLLERGFHLVYCDVAELYGNTTAVAYWNQFYGLMQRCGLSHRVVLEGMSRGGVYIYNWAMANPGKVACIYADAPVLDLKSWPGGKGKSADNRDNWEIFKKDYQLTEEQAISFKNSPLDNAKKIARMKFPILHVVGDADDVVPVSENTAPFEKIVTAAGGNITVIHKPGINHHPHSLPNPTPITDFILRATGHKMNFAAIPAAGFEYRSAAGWTEGNDWWAQFRNIDSLLLAEKNMDLLFLGNSITQGIGGHCNYVTYKPGLAAFDRMFAKYNWESAGISGDRTQQLLWRLEHGKYTAAKPRVMVITAGVNNFADNTAEEIVAGILAIVHRSISDMPSTQIILTGPLPTGLQKDTERRRKYEQVHRLLAKQKSRQYIYLPLTNVFVQPDGSLSTQDYAADGIHLVLNGYQKWAMALQPVIDKILHKQTTQ